MRRIPSWGPLLNMQDRRIYPPLVVVLTASLVCVTVWSISGCTPGGPASPEYLLLDSKNSSVSMNPFNLSLLQANDSHTLIDIDNFIFHKTGRACNASSTPLFVIIVHSSIDHWYNRQIIRDTWGRDAHLVFIVGETNSSDVQETLDGEDSEYHDIVQGSFLDSYRNLTYKHVLGLKWVTYNCPGVKYVLKVDDDVFVNTPFLTEFLTKVMSPMGARRLLLCEVTYNAIVKRSYRSKWRVSHSEYPDRYYPNYCMGWAILYSPDVVFLLYREAQRSEYFWVDDVHVTGTLAARLNLTHTRVGALAMPDSQGPEIINFGQVDDFLFGLVPPANVSELWSFVKSSFNNSFPQETKIS